VRTLSFALVFLAACGARTEPRSPGGERERDAGPFDAGPVDAGPTGIDAEVLDAAICGGDCDDGLFCNGEEFCTADGCLALSVPSCDDGNECTEDRCDPGTDACVNVEVDRDRDGDGLTSCGGDCDDRDARIFPGAEELCDMVDNDCDSDVDEGALSECRDCRPGCSIVTLPRETGDGWEDIGEESSGVEVDGMGRLRLSETRTESSHGWIANTAFSTITKLDLTDGTQAAEYDSVIRDGTNGARPPGERCQSDDDRPGAGNCPSRTAVDLRGAVYVANRAFDNQGTVTKIAGRVEDCTDRNGNGRIDTSEDRNGNGIIERDVDGEFLGQEDECLLWTVNVGAENGIPRAIAVDAEGFVWVGLNAEQRVLKLDPNDGRVLQNLSVRRDDFSPYGAAIASDGTLWLTEAATGRILSIDTETNTVGPTRVGESRDGCRGSYGIAVDELDRVWLAGFQCAYAFRYDPLARTWFTVTLPSSGSRGIAADDRGYIYVGSSHERLNIGPFGLDIGDPVARVTRFRADDGSDLRVFGTDDDPLPGLATVGVGLDNDRNVWLINQDSATATRVNPTTGASDEFPVGETPYTYSDFTGFALRTFTAPNGFLRTFVEGCPAGPTQWERITWDATLPRDTRLEVRVRVANTIEALRSTTWVGPFEDEPVDLTAPPGPLGSGRFMELEVTLVSEDESSSPRLETLDVQLNCPV